MNYNSAKSQFIGINILNCKIFSDFKTSMYFKIERILMMSCNVENNTIDSKNNQY